MKPLSQDWLLAAGAYPGLVWDITLIDCLEETLSGEGTDRTE